MHLEASLSLGQKVSYMLFDRKDRAGKETSEGQGAAKMGAFRLAGTTARGQGKDRRWLHSAVQVQWNYGLGAQDVFGDMEEQEQ